MQTLGISSTAHPHILQEFLKIAALVNKAPGTGWTPRSPDLRPFDFYLCGRINELVYSTHESTRVELLNHVNHAFTDLSLDEIRK